MEPAVSPSPSVWIPKKLHSKNGMSGQHLPGPVCSLECMKDQESSKIQMGLKDQLEVWSIRKNNKNPLEYNRDKPVGNAHTFLPIHTGDHDGIHCPLPDPSPWTHSFPLGPVNPSHSVGQYSQHRLLAHVDPQRPPDQPLNAQMCLPAACHHAPAPWVVPKALPSPSALPPPSTKALAGKGSSWRAGPVLYISTFPLTQGIH